MFEDRLGICSKAVRRKSRILEIANEHDHINFRGLLTHEQNVRWMQTVARAIKKWIPDAKCGTNLSGESHERPYASLHTYARKMLKDTYAPESVDWFKMIRSQCATPIAMGELFNNPMEWRDLIVNHYIDFIRCHLSQIGGLTPEIKLAHFCDVFGVRTAWHGPGDLAPIGMTAQVHLDLASHNFGIQEFAGFCDLEKEIFVGCPEVRNGYLYANDKPGFGIEFNEELALQCPNEYRPHSWLFAKLPDGTSVKA